MAQPITFKTLALGGLLLTLVAASSAVQAQLIQAPLDRGFAVSSSIEMSVDEMLGPQKVRAADEPILGPGFPHLWISEVQLKPVRLIRLPVRDPKTGETSRELVWYCVYRVIPRDYTELAGDGQDELIRKLEDPNFTPNNERDPVRAPSLRVPRFVIQTTDADSQQTYVDEVNLEAQRAILQREFGDRAGELKLYNTVEAIGEIPEPVSTHDEDPLAQALYGVAVWRNVDPRTDFFTMHVSGFSNAYSIRTDADGTRVVEEKVITQKFYRPGDEFVQDEQEFRLIRNEKQEETDPVTETKKTVEVVYPRWEYRVRKADLDVPNDLDSVLRSANRE
ncbi:MAG: hypothetical protein KDA85_17690 [Planctomycetaceae bacterium]|nr:hypothetical protein [Planctomycetaceae bacterium]